MRKLRWAVLPLCAVSLAVGVDAFAENICQGYGPQTPRDIASKAGTNPIRFTFAPPSNEMNLCDIHFHTNAEHKARGFSVFAGKGKHGGYQCNETSSLTEAELKPVDHGACHGVKPGDTIEVHWVHTSCDVAPAPGLTSCFTKQCSNPQLRVEAQAFLVVNDPEAMHFENFVYGGEAVNGFHQAKAIPAGTGAPVVFGGSTTGPSFTEQKCSTIQATWSVRPMCAKIDIESLNEWCKGNVFKEDHAHGVRQLVTAPELLAPIK